jgi:hypothetical protein
MARVFFELELNLQQQLVSERKGFGELLPARAPIKLVQGVFLLQPAYWFWSDSRSTLAKARQGSVADDHQSMVA